MIIEVVAGTGTVALIGIAMGYCRGAPGMFGKGSSSRSRVDVGRMRVVAIKY